MTVEAMNKEICAFVAPFLPPYRECADKAERAAYEAEFHAAWRDAMSKVDHIRIKHGLVRCEDAPGWRYVGAA